MPGTERYGYGEPVAGHYFSPEPQVESQRRSVPLHLVDFAVELQVDRGVFSADGIDSGTRLLLIEAARPEASKTTILDLGCGYGPIACTVAHRAPAATVYAVDVNERARQLCQDNAERLGLNVVVTDPDGVPPDVEFDLIVSNPPIRVGKAALHDMLTLWLARLAPAGRAELVVHKHLGSDSLARWLADQGYRVERLLSRGGYRILVVTASTDAGTE